jgi:hypothetical protein
MNRSDMTNYLQVDCTRLHVNRHPLQDECQQLARFVKVKLSRRR